MRSPKKTVSLFQSHVSKHEFFLLESCQFPVPSEFFLDSLSYNLLSMGGVTLIPWNLLENTEIMKLMYDHNKYVYLTII